MAATSSAWETFRITWALFRQRSLYTKIEKRFGTVCGKTTQLLINATRSRSRLTAHCVRSNSLRDIRWVTTRHCRRTRYKNSSTSSTMQTSQYASWKEPWVPERSEHGLDELSVRVPVHRDGHGHETPVVIRKVKRTARLP